MEQFSTVQGRRHRQGGLYPKVLSAVERYRNGSPCGVSGIIGFFSSGIGPRDPAFVLLLSNRMSVEGATLIGVGYTVLGDWFVTIFGCGVCGSGMVRFVHRQQGLSETRMSE